MTSPRGMNIQQAMEYVGVKRRTFDEKWMPRLTTFSNGTSKIIDRQDLDALFDEIKTESINNTWQAKPREYKAKRTEPSPSTKKLEGNAFANAASKVLGRQTNG